MRLEVLERDLDAVQKARPIVEPTRRGKNVDEGARRGVMERHGLDLAQLKLQDGRSILF